MSGFLRHGDNEISQVPGLPLFAFALLSDPGGTFASGHLTLGCCPRNHKYKDSRNVGTNEAQLHGFCDHCLRFTAMVTHGRARLASDCWPSFIGLDWLPTGSLRKVSAIHHPPFPSFPWRDIITPPGIHGHKQAPGGPGAVLSRTADYFTPAPKQGTGMRAPCRQRSACTAFRCWRAASGSGSP